MQKVFPILLAVLLFPAASCVAVAAAGAVGLGYFQYSKNEVVQDFDHDLQTTWRATLQALKQLEYAEPEEFDLGPTEGVVDGDGYHVQVELFVAEKTRVRVRVGMFSSEDNQRRAELILERITNLLDGDEDLRQWSEKVRAMSQNDS